MSSLDMARIKSIKTGMCNGGWNYDSHPYIESLDSKKTIEIAYIEGPATVNCIHVVKHEIVDRSGERGKYVSRGIVLLIYYNDEKTPAVEVPLADFFCDGLNGRTGHFSNIFFENSPESYNCYIMMPFEKSCRVCLRNDTSFDIMNYSYVEYEKLQKWDDSFGYFHATYNRIPFQLKPDTLLDIFDLKDCSGHILGRQLSISTNESAFAAFTYIMEGNIEIRIDKDKPLHHGPYERGNGPDYDYLGTECFFGCAWGWKKFIGNKFGCAYYDAFDFLKHIENELNSSSLNKDDYDKWFKKVVEGAHLKLRDLKGKDTLSQLSTYRFFYPNLIRFNESIDWRINWMHEYKTSGSIHQYRQMLGELAEDKNRLNVDFAQVMYWYQNKIGYDHVKLPEFEERI